MVIFLANYGKTTQPIKYNVYGHPRTMREILQVLENNLNWL